MTRKEAIERIKNDIEINHNRLADEYITALEMAIEALQQEPIIYCKDCKHWHEWENGAGSCHRSSIMWVGTDCDDYCSLAEGK